MTPLKAIFRYYRKKVGSFFRTETGKRVLKWIQRLITLGVLVWLGFELTNIGWGKVWRSLPTNPLFYLLFLLIYFQLPLFEILIYRITWYFNSVESVPIFLLKRVYNKDVLGYSGEVYFYLWARKHLDLKDAEVFKIIKDNNIISSVASTLVSIGLLSVFLFTDQIKIMDWFARQNQAYLYGGGILAVIAVAVFIKFRHYVISMPHSTAFKIFGIQVFRLLLGQFFNVLMYFVALPGTPLYIWFTFLSVEIILSRIPFLPNRDLIFTGMSIGIAEGLPVAPSAIAAIMLAKSVLNKLMNVAAFGLSSLLKKSEIVPDISEGKTEIPNFEEAGQKAE